MPSLIDAAAMLRAADAIGCHFRWLCQRHYFAIIFASFSARR